MQPTSSLRDDGDFESFLLQNFAFPKDDAFMAMMGTEQHSSGGSAEQGGDDDTAHMWLPGTRLAKSIQQERQQQPQCPLQRQPQQQQGTPPFGAPAAAAQSSPVFKFGTPDAQRDNAAALSGLAGSPALQETTKAAPVFEFQPQPAGTGRRLMAVSGNAAAQQPEQKLSWIEQYQLLLQQRQQEQQAREARQQVAQQLAQRQRQRQQQQRQGRGGDQEDGEEDATQHQQQQQQQQEEVSEWPPHIKLEDGADFAAAHGGDAPAWQRDSSASPATTPTTSSPQQKPEQKPKRIRKPSQAQRDAHKRFRERRKEQVAALEARVQQRMAQVAALTHENGVLAAQERVLSLAVSASDANLMLIKQMSCLALKEEVGDSSACLHQVHQEQQAQQRLLLQQQQQQALPGQAQAASLTWQQPLQLSVEQQRRQGSGDDAVSSSNSSSAQGRSGLQQPPQGQQGHVQLRTEQLPVEQLPSPQLSSPQPAQQPQQDGLMAQHGLPATLEVDVKLPATHSAARSPLSQQQTTFLNALLTVERLDRALVQQPPLQPNSITGGQVSKQFDAEPGLEHPRNDDVAWLQPLRKRLDVVVSLYKGYLQQVSPLLLQAQAAAQPPSPESTVMARIEELTLSLIGALRAWIISNKVPVAYIQAVNMDSGHWGELPPPDHWSKVVSLIVEHMGPQQRADVCTMSELFKTHMARLVEERRVLMAQLQQVAAMQTKGEVLGMDQLHSARRLEGAVCVREVLRALDRNMRKERTIENMFIAAFRQLLDPLQMALVCVHSWPYWPYLPAVAAAVQQRLQVAQQQEVANGLSLRAGLQRQAARSGGGRGRKQ